MNTLTYELGIKHGKTYIIPANADKEKYIKNLTQLAVKNDQPYLLGIADELKRKSLQAKCGATVYGYIKARSSL